MCLYSVRSLLGPLVTLVTLLLVYTVPCRGDCRFPPYLLTLGQAPSWIIRYQNDKTVKIEVRHNIMILEECTLSSGDCQIVDRHCRKDYGNDKFMVKEVVKKDKRYGNDYSFTCFQFIPRSKSVVQVRKSKSEQTVASTLCSDADLRLDKYPMVSREHMHEITPCPITGGYDFQMYTMNSPKAVCDDIFLPLRVESDCVKNEGMKFHFRWKECVSSHVNKSLDEEMEVRCIARWLYKGFVFSMVTWEKDHAFWCVRAHYINNGETLEEVIIYFSGICPSDSHQQRNAIILKDFQKHYVESVCADEGPKCEYGGKMCSPDKREHCRLSCKLCHPGEVEQTCNFPPTFLGTWHSLHAPNAEIVTITNSTMNQGKLTWHCVQSDETKQQRKEVIKVKFENGCYPRYMCLDLEIPALSVLRYRTGTQLSWPIASIQTVCEDRYFNTGVTESDEQDQHLPGGIPWYYFISDRPAYVTCNLPWYISRISPFVMYDANATERFRGCLINNSGSSRHILKMVYTHNKRIQATHLFLCLASLKFIGENDQLITQNVKTGDYMCWTFIKGRENNVFIYLYKASDCGNGTNFQMSQTYHPKLILVIRPNASDCDFIEDDQRASILRRSDSTVSELNRSGTWAANFQQPGTYSLSLFLSWLVWSLCV